MSEQVAAPPRREPEEPEAPKESAEPEGRPHWWDPLVIPALAVITALAVGALVIIFSDPAVLSSWGGFLRHPLETLRLSGQVVADSYRALLVGAFGSPTDIWHGITSGDLSQFRHSLYPISETITMATPLIFAGLAVAVGFRAGLFNIGAEGQITVGAIVAAAVGFSFPGLPGFLHVILMVLAGFAGGALYGFIPGILKAKTGAHEVIVTIMLNWISYPLAFYCLHTRFFQRPGRTDPISKPVHGAFPLLLGGDLRIHLGILVAIAVAAGVAFLINRTTLGFAFRAVGANPDAARAAGVSPTRIYVVVMTLAGGLAGLAGANQLLSVTPSLTPGFSSGFGFDAIALALLGQSNPWGVVAAALLFGALRAGSRSMQAATATPVDIVVVIQALVIVFIAAPALVRAIFRFRARGPAGLGVPKKGWG